MNKRFLQHREALIVVFFSALNPVTGLLANRALTQAVPPEALGGLYLYMNLGLWLTLPTASAFIWIQRHWTVARAQHAERAFGVGLQRGLFAQAAVCALGVLLLRALGLLEAGPFVALLLFTHAMGQACAQALTTIQAQERRRVLSGVVDFFTTPGRQLVLAAGAALLFTRQSGEGLLALQAGWSLVMGGAAVALLLRLLARSGPQAARPVEELGLRSFLSYSGPYLFTALLGQVAATQERWGLARFSSPASTALFVQAVGLSTAMAGAFVAVLNNYFYPLVSQAAAADAFPLRGAARMVRTYLALTCVALLGLTLLVGAASGPLTSLLFGPRYEQVRALLPWTTLGAALFALGQGLAIVPYVTRDPLGPNLARSLSLAAYAAALYVVPHAPDAARAYAQVFAAGSGVYVLCMLVVTSLQVRRHRERLAAAAAE